MVHRKKTMKKGKKADWAKSVTKPKGSRFGAMNSYRVKAEPFPRVMYTTCKYFENSLLTTLSGFGTAVRHTYRMNSIRDPDFLGFGRTVAGWTQLNAIYRKYLVTGAKINIRFYDPSSDNMRVGVRLRIGEQSASSTAGQDLQQLGEVPLTYIRGIANSGSQKTNFTFHIKPWTLIGLSKLEYFANRSRNQALMAESPMDAALIDVFAISTSSLAIAVPYTVKIEFDVQFNERIALASTAI